MYTSQIIRLHSESSSSSWTTNKKQISTKNAVLKSGLLFWLTGRPAVHFAVQGSFFFLFQRDHQKHRQRSDDDRNRRATCRFFLIKFFNSLFLFFSLLTLPTHDTTVRYLLPLLLLWLMASDVDSHIVNECERQRNLFRNRAEGTKKPDPSVLCSHPWGLHASFASRDRSLCSCDVHYVPNHVKAGHISYENPSTPPPRAARDAETWEDNRRRWSVRVQTHL